MKSKARKRRKRTKPTSAMLKKKAAKLFREIVIERDNAQCQRCSRRDWLQVHHIIRQARSLRMQVDPTNGLVLCRDCHSWWHGCDPVGALWFADKWPERALYVQERYFQTRKRGTVNYCEWLSIVEDLETWNGRAVEAELE